MLVGTADMWRAMRENDPGSDGSFVYSVTTTGIYNRPSCPARRPRVDHVVFFATAADAERAGFRRCRRCRPDLSTAERGHLHIIVRACRAMDVAVGPPGLADLASVVGFSPFHFHRTFRASTGLTPHQYYAARRFERLRHELTRSSTVTDAIYEAGYGSNGHFYSRAGGMLGMTPSRFREGGLDIALGYAVTSTALGPVLVALADQGVCEVLAGDSDASLVERLRLCYPRASDLRRSTALDHLLARVGPTAELPPAARDLPWDIRLTATADRLRRELAPGVEALLAPEGTVRRTMRGA